MLLQQIEQLMGFEEKFGAIFDLKEEIEGPQTTYYHFAFQILVMASHYSIYFPLRAMHATEIGQEENLDGAKVRLVLSDRLSQIHSSRFRPFGSSS